MKSSVRSLLFLSAVSTALLIASSPLQAQEVYTNLKDPEQIAIFNEVSDSVICQCGCHFVLSSCPHVECPWGIPVRRFMENRIREGMQAPEIIEKLENGFGAAYMNDPVILELEQQGRSDLVDKIVNGHGPAIRATTANWIPVLLISVFCIAGLLIAIRYFRKKDPFGDLSQPEGPEEKTNSTESDTIDLDRFKDLDR